MSTCSTSGWEKKLGPTTKEKTCNMGYTKFENRDCSNNNTDNHIKFSVIYNEYDNINMNNNITPDRNDNTNNKHNIA